MLKRHRRLILTLVAVTLQCLVVWREWDSMSQSPLLLGLVGLIIASGPIVMWLTRPSKIGARASRRAARILSVAALALAGLVWLLPDILEAIAELLN